MWVWWFFWVYGFYLLEVSMEDGVWIWKMWTSSVVAVACSKRRISCPWVGIWVCLKLTWVGIWVCLRLVWLRLFKFGYPCSFFGFMNFICWRFVVDWKMRKSGFELWFWISGFLFLVYVHVSSCFNFFKNFIATVNF